GSESPHGSEDAGTAQTRPAVWVCVEPGPGKTHRAIRLWHLSQLHLPSDVPNHTLQSPFRAGAGNQYTEFGGRPRAGRSRTGHEADSARSTEPVSVEPGSGHSL